jgi:hypothetical protein
VNGARLLFVLVCCASWFGVYTLLRCVAGENQQQNRDRELYFTLPRIQRIAIQVCQQIQPVRMLWTCAFQLCCTLPNAMRWRPGL